MKLLHFYGQCYEPVTSSVPMLVMSGQIDPVTPPVWDEETAKHLSASKHIVIPGTGHTAGGTGCGVRMIRAFLTKGSSIPVVWPT